ncbi:hypothetical protein A5634_05035 [Mycobacterium asiaticum]|uniref:Uncharacterized protein n=1 Tax=Mycobacterium asiaticum TaxID=1790 RepID=A0A1A3NR06_MYCAS|nr:hypothetical protein A5634_05035 [Mycobacterium asiaticum]
MLAAPLATGLALKVQTVAVALVVIEIDLAGMTLAAETRVHDLMLRHRRHWTPANVGLDRGQRQDTLATPARCAPSSPRMTA